MKGTGARAPIPADIGSEEFASIFDVSRETLDRLRIYAGRLENWQKRINLVAPSTVKAVWQRHFADSAQLLDLAPAEVTDWLDLGSGAGFPGLVLAILRADQPGRRAILVESDQRKCAFMAEVVRATGLSSAMVVEITNRRIEDAATRAKVGNADVVSARALASLDQLLTLAAPWLAEGAVGLFLKGRMVQGEIDAAEEHWRFSHELVASRTDVDGRIVVVRSIAAKTED